MKKQDQDEQVRRAKAALKRVEEQSEKLFGAGPTQMDQKKADKIDLLGKRIGRGIGYALVIFLLWHLTTTYFIK